MMFATPRIYSRATRSRRSGSLLVKHLTLVMGNLGICIINEGGVILFAINEGKGIYHLHQCTIGIITCCASCLQCTNSYTYFLIGALQGKSSYTLVCFLQVGNECCQTQLCYLCSVLIFKVGNEVDQKLLCLQWKCGLGLEMALSVDARRGSAPCRWAFPGVLFIIKKMLERNFW